ncbi:unnamed protein product [Brassicogethes aeneus]|uniref:RING-type E3 ubiquitin transferase n=1 Tax=Brassicogethes aeneus TaxID=1431903 RepID=A0A9P0ANG1_BRAAE|nr:unnamed protein product [Brassicogethes aeneus]
MPIQAPQWTEFLSCQVCCNSFDDKVRKPISLGCGHTICKACLSNLHRKQCPFDQTTITVDIDILPVNTALLQLIVPGAASDLDESNVDFKVVPRENVNAYLESTKCVEELAMYLKPYPNGNVCSGSILSRPMQRKLVTLINCQLVEDEGRTRAMRAARSLGERTVTELILQHQNPQQLSANLWAAVRARGCQFLGPAMQEEVLKLVLLALEDGSALSRKVLVMFVVQRLEPHFPQASKTSIGHVVQLLYRASCFKVSKREGDSSLMQLKDEFRTYEALRREHDAQIVQIATEAGLRIAPDQWSALLYGDAAHKSHMQSIVDKLQTPQSFAQSVQELVIALQRTGDPGKLAALRGQLELLANIDPSPESSALSWSDCGECLEAVRQVVAGLVEFIHQHGSRKVQDSAHSQHTRYKISMCRDLTLRGSCPRGTNCTFAHSNEELEKYRAKNRKMMSRSKEHRIESQSPTDKAYAPGHNDDYYAIPQNADATVSPVPIHAVLPMPRYDVPFNAAPAYAQNQQPYPSPTYMAPPQPAAYPAYAQPPPASVVLTNGNPYYAEPEDFVKMGHQHVNVNVNDLAKRHIWDHMKNHIPTQAAQKPMPIRAHTKSLAELHQRKLEVLTQLEKVVGKNAATEISHTAATLARQESMQDCESPTSPYNFFGSHVFNTGPTFVRSDSILTADDDYVPYDSPAISKYGPISRMPKDNGMGQPMPVSGFRDGGVSSSMLRRPVSSPSPVTPYYYNNNSQYLQGNLPPHMVGPQVTGINDGFVTYPGSSPMIIHGRMQDPSKEMLMAESQRVQLQLRNLEKQLNDLKMAAAHNVTSLSESDRLTQELQLIEQGITEKQKEAHLNKIVHSLGISSYSNGNTSEQVLDNAINEEEDIRMKALELRLKEELEQLSEDDSPKPVH